MSRRSRDLESDAKGYALKLLGYRSRSRRELKDRLSRKGFNDEHINGALEFLENAGLLNDETLAKELFREAVERRHFGKKGAAQFLLKRGIGKELAGESASALTREKEEESAVRLVEKKLKALKNYPEDVVRRRILGMLHRRGFSSDIISVVIKDARFMI